MITRSDFPLRVAPYTPSGATRSIPRRAAADFAQVDVHAVDELAVTVRRAGQHARQRTRRLALRGLMLLGAIAAVAVMLGTVAGFTSPVFAVGELGAIAAVTVLDRRLTPAIDRWDRGAAGEEHVGRILGGLAAAGWLAIHDATVSRGNIDHILVGPGGLLTIETKSHGGRVAVERIDESMLKQSYAQSKLLERITGREVTPLLVFSRAYLSRPVSQRRGVTILPARMLPGYLARRPQRLSIDEVVELHARLGAALADSGS